MNGINFFFKTAEKSTCHSKRGFVVVGVFVVNKNFLLSIWLLLLITFSMAVFLLIDVIFRHRSKRKKGKNNKTKVSTKVNVDW